MLATVGYICLAFIFPWFHTYILPYMYIFMLAYARVFVVALVVVYSFCRLLLLLYLLLLQLFVWILWAIHQHHNCLICICCCCCSTFIAYDEGNSHFLKCCSISWFCIFWQLVGYGDFLLPFSPLSACFFFAHFHFFNYIRKVI